MGSKARFAKQIIAKMQPDLLQANGYVEPFAGGFNMLCEINHEKRFANDVNKYVIALFYALSLGWEPPEFVTKEEYVKAKNGQYNDALTGYIGFCCSYSGKWFGGYAGIVQTKGGERNYIAEARRNLMKQAPKLKNVLFDSRDYQTIRMPIDNCLIYCDPPYKGTTGYSLGEFNSDKFYKWCEDQVEKGHVVYVSEYSAPWPCVWEKQASSSLSANGKVGSNKISVERLFKVEL